MSDLGVRATSPLEWTVSFPATAGTPPEGQVAYAPLLAASAAERSSSDSRASCFAI